MKAGPSVVQVVRGFATEFSAARLKVRVAFKKTTGQWSHRRFGFEFGKEAVEIEPGQLGADPVQVADAIVKLATEKQSDTGTETLAVILAVPDLPEKAIGDSEVAELRAFVAARGVVAE